MNFILKATFSACIVITHVAGQGTEKTPTLSPQQTTPAITPINLAAMLASANAPSAAQEELAPQINTATEPSSPPPAKKRTLRKKKAAKNGTSSNNIIQARL